MISPQITWNDEWRHPTESIYGIAAKLAIANCIMVDEALLCCGGKSGLAPLWDWRWHSSSRITALEEGGTLSTPVAAYSMHEPYYLFSLRFCRKCLAVGFHSVAHQNRLLTTCPAHELLLEEYCPRCHSLLLPTGGAPWTCAACGFSLALDDVRNWVSAFKQYPGRNLFTWTEAERRAYEVHSDTELMYLGTNDRFYGDYHYWEGNWRELHLWYFNALLLTTRQWFWRHRACFLEHFSLERSMCDRPYLCPVAKTFSYLVRQMGVNTDSQQPALLAKETKSAVMLELVEPLFAREQAAYLKSEPACLVIRDLAQARFASVLDSFLLNETPRASVYCRNWHFSNSKFILAPSISRSAFKRLSIAADIFCARRA